MPHRRFQRIGSFLALFAMLLATVAPTISQALEAHGRLDTALRHYCSVQTPADGTGRSTPDSTGFHWQACGYCSLLSHLPVVPGAVAAPVQVSTFSTHLVVRMSADTRAQTVRTPAQPRAPPAIARLS
ncbi:DUF2946 domain-containing protein [Paraburkholderia megapolitana]|uniref:DUF2946 domain-containing protein n=1 Tax=Paraburkholderia megapolitana TaxID=420953 RepID=A0A1I3EHX9_9BURK|nr:DUF2946 domain-containing protein [Paraburkholderia megapolitana]QDQ80096.1 DUF2946 domain-containing protein [Paraburkholderia megapolitana]SFH98557.1 Protein of unknown function [Paraburkholderia megapolitana]